MQAHTRMLFLSKNPSRTVQYLLTWLHTQPCAYTHDFHSIPQIAEDIITFTENLQSLQNSIEDRRARVISTPQAVEDIISFLDTSQAVLSKFYETQERST